MAGWLEGKTAIVTGSGRGIGRSVAMRMAQEGAKVVVVDPGVNVDGSGGDAGPAQQTVDAIIAAGGTAVASTESVAISEGGEKIIKTALDNWGRLDILVNVAGILRDRMIFNMSPEEWKAVLDVHLKGHFNMIKPASVLMRQQRYGRIINFSSVSGQLGNAGQANYAAAKAGIAGLTRVVSRDLGRYGVTCNAISPLAATRMGATIPATARTMRVASGMNTLEPDPASDRDPEQVAPMACYLASDEAWNVNGQIFAVAGGRVSVLNHPIAYRTIFNFGLWSMDELDAMVPEGLMQGTRNPAPPANDLDVPGRGVVEAKEEASA